MARFRLLMAMPFLLVGIGLLIAVGFKYSDERDVIERAQHLIGVVIAAPDNGVPVVELRDRAGRSIRIEGRISTSPSPYEIGEAIGVFFDPATGQGIIDSFVERWFVILLLGGFGLVATTIGAGSALAALRARRRLQPGGFARSDGVSTARSSAANDVFRRM